MCAKNHLLIFSSFLDIWEKVEWPRFLDHPVVKVFDYALLSEKVSRMQCVTRNKTKAKQKLKETLTFLLLFFWHEYWNIDFLLLRLVLDTVELIVVI